jgi:transposase
VIGPKGRVRVFAYSQPCDMRKSFNTLSGLVSSMGHDVASGDVFAFVSRNKKRAKVLWYDGTGLCLLAKRLDQGRFAALWGGEVAGVELSMSELALLVEGCTLVGRVPLSPTRVDTERAGRVDVSDFR